MSFIPYKRASAVAFVAFLMLRENEMMAKYDAEKKMEQRRERERKKEHCVNNSKGHHD